MVGAVAHETRGKRCQGECRAGGVAPAAGAGNDQAMSLTRTDENGVTKKLVKWATRSRKGASRKWVKKWVVVPPKKAKA